MYARKLLCAFGLATVLAGPAAAGEMKVAFAYGGNWVDTNSVASGEFSSMVGTFAGTNRMKAGDETWILGFKCTGIIHSEPWVATGACPMTLPNGGDHFVLSWACKPGDGGAFDCSGKVYGGTGRFEGASGAMSWKDWGGFGEGGGTLATK